MREARSKTAVAHAVKVAKRGVPVIWIPHGTKAPMVKDWANAATPDGATISRWAAAHEGCNFGLVMGGGFVAIDVDGREGIAAIQAAGLDLPATYTQVTPGGGLHFIYRVSVGVEVGNRVGLFPTVDIRGKGGQVVCAGSVHPNGGIYEVADDAPIAKLPDEWLSLLTTQQRSTRGTPRGGDIPPGQRNDTLFREGAAIRSRGMAQEAIDAALIQRNSRLSEPLPDAEVRKIAASAAKYEPRPEAVAMLNDPRPKIALPHDNWLLSEFARELGCSPLRDALFVRGGEVVMLEGDRVVSVTAQTFRTLLERHVVCVKYRRERNGSFEVGVSLTESDARGVLASGQFKQKLRPLRHVNDVRLPVIRGEGRIGLLPLGYDEDTATFTVSGVEYDSEMPMEDARAIIDDLFSEFGFVDARSLAVAVAALIGLFAQQVLPCNTFRPVFLYLKNAEGAGGTTCAKCAIVPILGYAPTTTMPSDDSEMKKFLTSTLREGRRVVLFDNVRSTIGGGALEGFTTAAKWRDRLLGVNETVELDNDTSVFVTGNGATCTPDMARRALQIELHLSEERAADKVFHRPLNDSVLCSMRSRVLSACWAFVREWDAAGRPAPSRQHSAFPEWAACIGGVVQHAGFACPFDAPASSFAVDEDGQAMRVLTASMKMGRKYTAPELFAFCRAENVFLHLVGLHDGDMQRGAFVTMGRLLARYNRRLVGARRFLIEGTGHAKRFLVVEASSDLHDMHALHALSSKLPKHEKSSLGKRACKACNRATIAASGTLPKYTRKEIPTQHESFNR